MDPLVYLAPGMHETDYSLESSMDHFDIPISHSPSHYNIAIGHGGYDAHGLPHDHLDSMASMPLDPQLASVFTFRTFS